MGITDGSVYCGRCGEDRTVCSLCVGEPLMLVRAGGERLGPTYEDEKEIMAQTRSIKAAAAKRQGF